MARARRPTARRRRPNWPALAVVVTFLVGVGALIAGTLGEGPDRNLAYLDQVRPLVERSNQQGIDLAEMRAQVVAAGRTATDRRLQRLATQAAAVARLAADIEPPHELRTAHGLLLAALTVRADATDKLREAMTASVAEGTVLEAAERLSAVGRDLLVGDRAYQLFAEGSSPGARPPRSVWVPDARLWDIGETAATVASMRSSGSLAPVHDTAVITFTTDPAPAGLEGTTDVLPTVPLVALQAIVANAGNERERRVAVVATLTYEPSGATDTSRVFVDLEAGQRRTVTIAGLRSVPGGRSRLTVRVGPVNGELSTSDNERSRTFVMR